MVITWYGKNCFKLQSGNLVVITDPFEKENNLSPFRGRADIIIRTLTELPSKNHFSTEAFEIDYAGEYEIKNVKVQGWSVSSGQAKILRTVYVLKIDELKIVLLGHLSDENEIKDFQEFLEGADIVFIPFGGEYCFGAGAAAKLIRQLKPCLVIPTLFNNLAELKPFFKELGQNDIVPLEKISVSKKDMNQDKLIIGCLKI